MDSYAVYPSLKGRAVFVTGGATGIGESIVTQFCRQGSKVAFVDINAQAGEKLRSRLAEEAGNAPEFLQCSVTDIDALQAAIREVQQQAGHDPRAGQQRRQRRSPQHRIGDARSTGTSAWR